MRDVSFCYRRSWPPERKKSRKEEQTGWGSTPPLASGGELTLEGGRAHDERLLEGVGPGGAELRRSHRLQGKAPLGDGRHGGGGGDGGLVECRLVV